MNKEALWNNRKTIWGSFEPTPSSKCFRANFNFTHTQFSNLLIDKIWNNEAWQIYIIAIRTSNTARSVPQLGNTVLFFLYLIWTWRVQRTAMTNDFKNRYREVYETSNIVLTLKLITVNTYYDWFIAVHYLVFVVVNLNYMSNKYGVHVVCYFKLGTDDIVATWSISVTCCLLPFGRFWSSMQKLYADITAKN